MEQNMKKNSYIYLSHFAAQLLWPPYAKSRLTGKDPDSGKEWRQEEKAMTEDKMVGWHHWLNRYEFKQAPGDDEGQGSLACCSPWRHKQLDMIEQLNNNNKINKTGGKDKGPFQEDWLFLQLFISIWGLIWAFLGISHKLQL